MVCSVALISFKYYDKWINREEIRMNIYWRSSMVIEIRIVIEDIEEIG